MMRIACLLRISRMMRFAATSYALGMSGSGPGLYARHCRLSSPLPATSLSALWPELACQHGRRALRPYNRILGFGISATVILTLIIGRLGEHALTDDLQ